MKVQDIFSFHSDLGCLQRNTQDDIQPQFRQATSTLFGAVEQGTLLIIRFFGKHCLPPTELPDNDESRATNHFTPFVDCLAFSLPPNKGFEDVNTKIFRQTCSRNGPLPEMLRHIRSLHWLSFWSLNLTAIQRNIVFRLIHLKIPHKALLHRFLPAKVESSQCSICLIHEDSLEYFLFDCPPKSVIWQSIIREFLWPSINTQDIHSALKTLNFDSITYYSNRKIPAKLLLIITLANIWKAHWYSIFNQTPFETTQVLHPIHSDIQTCIAENTDLD
ncbi:unnamed protein product [Rhizopus stolonifer]